MAYDSVVSADDPRDLRIIQLQYALDSRVVVEQAKGILAERFGLRMTDSFELLRQAARSHQLKVQTLAAELVESRMTPVAIIDTLVRSGHPRVDEFARLAVDTEQLFADLNDALIVLHRKTHWSTFVCECSNPLCSKTITLSAESLAKIHEHPRHYVVKAGHELPDIETVIDTIDGLVITEKPARA